MNRNEAIKKILRNVEDQDIIITSTGMTSRELYNIKDRPLNFYMMGSMGNALAIGLGMALNTDRKVIVINGDASALMSLGTMVTHNKLRPNNLYHYILDNNCHASTGGQATASDKVNFSKLAPNTIVYSIIKEPNKAPRIPFTGKEITARFTEAINKEVVKPMASILIPCFKRVELLNWGLFSLAKQESPYPFEVIVLNDGIDDGTKELCKKYSDRLNIRYIYTGHRNEEKIIWRCPGFCLNIGVKKAKSDYIILTCPEIFHLDKFAVKKTIEKLQSKRKIMVKPEGWDDQKNHYLTHVIETKGEVNPEFTVNNMVELHTTLPFFLGLHREEFTCIGGYDEDLIGWAFDDTDLIRRMRCYGIKYETIDSTIVHLYHPRHRQGIEENRKMFLYNKKIYEYKCKSGVLYSNKTREWGVLDKDYNNYFDHKLYTEKLWKFKKIPQVAHFYWGNEKLPYLRYLSILSFKIHNPEWQIKLYVPPTSYKGRCLDTQSAFDFTGVDYFPNLRSIKEIEIIKVNFDFIDNACEGLEGTHLSRQEVYRSDFLRWHLLGTEGGLWSDMDIMFFKPVSDMYINKKGNEEATTLISLHPKYGHSVGFMLSAPNNLYYVYILKEAKKNFNPVDYQSIGVNLLNKDFGSIEKIETRFNELEGTVKDIPVTTVYAYDALVIPTIYNYSNMGRYTFNSIGLHWYAGHHIAKKYIKEITHLNYNNYTNVLGKTIKKVYGQ